MLNRTCACTFSGMTDVACTVSLLVPTCLGIKPDVKLHTSRGGLGEAHLDIHAYWPGVDIRGNLTYHITVHFRVFLEKPRFCYRNGHHKQYILVDTIFNYRFHFGLPGKCLYLSPQNTPFWRRRSRRQKGVFPGLFYRHFPGSPK